MKATMNIIGIIPAAGFGTRFLPFTKTVPKELVPLNGVPAIEYILRELVANNVTEIYVITSPYKGLLADYFQHNYVVDNFLKKTHKENLLEEHYKTLLAINFTFAFQEEPLGLGNAIAQAKEFAQQSLSVITLPDDIISDPLLIQFMIEQAKQHNASIIAIAKVPLERVSSYGIVALGEQIEKNLFSITDIIEKPSPDNAPSQYAVIGRYVLQPEIFAMLDAIKPGRNGEFQLTDAIALLIQSNFPVYAFIYEGKRFDVGNPIGFMEANHYYSNK